MGIERAVCSASIAPRGPPPVGEGGLGSDKTLHLTERNVAMRNVWLTVAVGVLAVALIGCGSEETVPTGTYKGTVEKVVPDEKEIYVKLDDGRLLELYFTETTKLTRNGAPAEFGALAKGQAVQVAVENPGDGHLKPLSVDIEGE
jgi:hypothetical protein